MNTKSSKAKGRRLQQAVVSSILEKYPFLREDDVKSTAMGQNGMDVQLSTAAQISFPFAVECKSRKAFSIYSLMDQASANSSDRLMPMCVIKADRKEPLVVLSLENFMKVIE